MSANDWLISLQLGMVAGAIGQLVRAIVGLAKKDDAGEAKEFVASRLVLSVVIGATAGALVVVVGVIKINPGDVDTETILGLAAAGYAGTDLIEGLVGKLLGKSPTPKKSSSKTPAPPPGNG